MQRSASAMEELADHYGISSIHFGVKVAELEVAGELVIKAPKPDDLKNFKPMVFSSDGVHPHAETGHPLYTEAIARSWPAIWSAGKAERDQALPEPLRDDNWENARQVPITEAMLKGTWEKLPEDHTWRRDLLATCRRCSRRHKLEQRWSFPFVARALRFLICWDQMVAVSLSRSMMRSRVARKRIDAYCTYHRMAKTPILSDADNAVYRVRVTLADEQLDKRNILFEKNRANFDAKPEEIC